MLASEGSGQRRWGLQVGTSRFWFGLLLPSSTYVPIWAAVSRAPLSDVLPGPAPRTTMAHRSDCQGGGRILEGRMGGVIVGHMTVDVY